MSGDAVWATVGQRWRIRESKLLLAVSFYIFGKCMRLGCLLACYTCKERVLVRASRCCFAVQAERERERVREDVHRLV